MKYLIARFMTLCAVALLCQPAFAAGLIHPINSGKSSAQHTKASPAPTVETVVQSKEDNGVLTTIGPDGTEYVIDTKNHLAFIRKSGIVLDSRMLDRPGQASTTLADTDSLEIIDGGSDHQ